MDLPGQALELARRARQPGPGEDRGLIAEVVVAGAACVGAADRGAQAAQRAFELGDRQLVLEQQLLQRERAERGPQRVDLEDVERVQLRHHGAAVGDHVDQAVALEQPEGVADRAARDAELLGERDLLQPLAGFEAAVEDRGAQRLDGHVDVRRRRAAPADTQLGGHTMLRSGRRSARAKRSTASGEMSAKVGRLRTRSRSSSPVAGPCRKPWPENPVA